VAGPRPSRSRPLPFPERPRFGSGLLLTTVLTASRPFDEEMATSMLVLLMLLLPKVTLSAPVLMVEVMVAVLTVVAVGVVSVLLAIGAAAVIAVSLGASGLMLLETIAPPKVGLGAVAVSRVSSGV